MPENLVVGPTGLEDERGDSTGGQYVNPYGPSDTLSAKGTTAATPAAGTAIATIAAPGAGTYNVRAVVFITGAVGANEINNAAVFHATTKSADVPVINVLNVMQYMIEIPRMTILGGEAIILQTGTSVGTTSSVYSGVIHATLVQ